MTARYLPEYTNSELLSELARRMGPELEDPIAGPLHPDTEQEVGWIEIDPVTPVTAPTFKYVEPAVPGSWDHRSGDCEPHGLNVAFARPKGSSVRFECVACLLAAGAASE